MVTTTPLCAVPAKKIVRAISSAAERWSDADFPPRVRVLGKIAERTGYALPAVEYALDRLFFSVTPSALEATIRAELGSLAILDGFAPREGRPDAWAAPAGNVCVISSRTTVGVALVPALFALCAKCTVLVKDREDSLVAAFFETLTEELDEFAGAARAATWTSNDAGAPEMRAFDAVAAFGSDGALQAIRASLHPQARFIGYGPRASAGYVTRESLGDLAAVNEIARGAARDVVLYESEGCLSLHVLFVERAGAVSAEGFASALAQAVQRSGVEFPPGRREPAVQARLAHHRNLSAFRAAGGKGAVFANDAADFSLAFDPPLDEPPAFLPRSPAVIPVDEPAQALAYLRAHGVALE